MKKNTWIQLVIILSLLLSTCTAFPSPTLKEDAAAVAVEDYFQSLYLGDYDAAVDLYGGPYTVLENYNPDIDPAEKAQLLQRACQANGFVCLSVKEVVTVEAVSPGKFSISVSFQTPEGELFVRSDCCGSTAAKNELETVFTFQVEENQAGQAQVMDLPVYVP